MKYKDITPSVELMHAQFAQGITWARAIGELLDNSIDSGARRVRIAISPHEFRIDDNGGGTSDPTLLVHLAGREDHQSTRVGRYGRSRRARAGSTSRQRRGSPAPRLRSCPTRLGSSPLRRVCEAAE